MDAQQVKPFLEDDEQKAKFRNQYEELSEEEKEKLDAVKDPSEAVVLKSLCGSKYNAIKYLNVIEAAKQLKARPDLHNTYSEAFVESVRLPKPGDGEFLDRVIKEYTGRLAEQEEYKRFVAEVEQ